MNALFVMPHYSAGNAHSVRFLKEAVNSVLAQSVPDWHLIIVDDASTDQEAVDYLRYIQLAHPARITLLFNTENIGPGGCRNQAVTFGYDNNFDLIFYIDADDICHPDRLKICRELFASNPQVDLVYSTFSVIDEYSNPVDYSALCGSIKEILDSHARPPQGHNAWIDIAIKTGYTNLTSATAIRTALARQFPFPLVKVSEDMHTWLRCSAGGGEFKFCPTELTQYRIPQQTKGSASRTREGGELSFYKMKSAVDEEGFQLAYGEAVKLGKVKADTQGQLFSMFYQKLAVTMIKAGQYDLAIEQFGKSLAINEGALASLCR